MGDAHRFAVRFRVEVIYEVDCSDPRVHERLLAREIEGEQLPYSQVGAGKFDGCGVVSYSLSRKGMKAKIIGPVMDDGYERWKKALEELRVSDVEHALVR